MQKIATRQFFQRGLKNGFDTTLHHKGYITFPISNLLGVEQLRWEQKQPEGKEIHLKVHRKGEKTPREFRIKVRALPKLPP